MEKAIVLNTDDIKEIVAEKFCVDVSKIIKSQYSYTVIGVSEVDSYGTRKEPAH